jgi:histidine triad (HIT) family protein
MTTETECAFCEIGAGRVDADLVAYRSANTVVVPALLQRARNPGHAVVIPVRHVVGLASADTDLLREVFAVTALVAEGVKTAFGAVGSTVVQNNDAPGQVLHHLHVGVVPRFPDDGFRMPQPGLVPAPRAVRLARAAALRAALASDDASTTPEASRS